MSNGISIRRLPYDDLTWWHINLCASNGVYSAAQDFYVYPDDLNDLGRCLIGFPRDFRDEVRYDEQGSRSKNWAYYVLLRAFLYDSVGHAALEFAVDNRCSIPSHAQASFYILCEVAALNRLGEQLCAWIHHPDEPLIWNTQNA